MRGIKQAGATRLLSRHRGKPSHPRLPAETLALSLVRERYPDFGPTQAAEKLATQHGCSISHETVRGWMIADELWIDHRHKLRSPHQPRRQHAYPGELAQPAGSYCELLTARLLDTCHPLSGGIVAAAVLGYSNGTGPV